MLRGLALLVVVVVAACATPTSPAELEAVSGSAIRGVDHLKWSPWLGAYEGQWGRLTTAYLQVVEVNDGRARGYLLMWGGDPEDVSRTAEIEGPMKGAHWEWAVVTSGCMGRGAGVFRLMGETVTGSGQIPDCAAFGRVVLVRVE